MASLKVVVLYDDEPGRAADVIDVRTHDLVLIWREWGNRFENGTRTHVLPAGAWANVSDEALAEVLERLKAF